MAAGAFTPGLELKLRADKVSYGYPGHRVGNDLSLTVNDGEVLCLLGPNGCGKTTLFKSLLGLLPVSSGSVLLDDRDLRFSFFRTGSRAHGTQRAYWIVLCPFPF